MSGHRRDTISGARQNSHTCRSNIWAVKTCMVVGFLSMHMVRPKRPCCLWATLIDCTAHWFRSLHLHDQDATELEAWGFMQFASLESQFFVMYTETQEFLGRKIFSWVRKCKNIQEYVILAFFPAYFSSSTNRVIYPPTPAMRATNSSSFTGNRAALAWPAVQPVLCNSFHCAVYLAYGVS